MILILEDELIIADNLRSNLIDMGYEVHEPCLSYEELRSVLSQTKPSMVLVDINLEADKSGFDVAKILNKEGIPFIFLTSYSDQGTIEKASIYNPDGYITKPYNPDTIRSTIEISLAKRKRKSENKIIRITHKGLNVTIDSNDILFVKSENVYIEIVTGEEKYLVRSTLAKIKEKLNSCNFQQTPRGYILNMKNVEAYKNDTITIGEFKIPVSRKYRSNIKGVN